MKIKYLREYYEIGEELVIGRDSATCDLVVNPMFLGVSRNKEKAV